MRTALRGTIAAVAALILVCCGSLALVVLADEGVDTGPVCFEQADDGACLVLLAPETLEALAVACGVEMPEDVDGCVRARATELQQAQPAFDIEAQSEREDSPPPSPVVAPAVPVLSDSPPTPPQTRTIGPAAVVTAPFTRVAPPAPRENEPRLAPAAPRQHLPPGPPSRLP
jgi:hypothetical protein